MLNPDVKVFLSKPIRIAFMSRTLVAGLEFKSLLWNLNQLDVHHHRKSSKGLVNKTE